MKRVLYYLSTFPVFSQTFITREIEGLIARGKLDVYILSLEQGRKASVPEKLRDRVIYFTKPKSERVFDGIKYALFHPVKFFNVFTKYSDRLLSVGTAISMLPVVKKLKPDLIHANWITEGALMGNIISDLTGIPFSIECHAEDIWLSNASDIQRRIEDSKLVLTCTEFNKEYLKKVLDKHLWEKVKTVYHHLEGDTFGGRTTQFNDIPVIYLVGRMVEKKGFLYFIEAAKILKDRGLSFKARIAGDTGTEKDKLIALSKQLGVNEYVSFTGEVVFNEHSHNYLESDIFVMPSIKPENGNLDGIPNVIVEAMLAGLPVVASRISAIPELIEDGKTGFLVNEKDEKMLADRLEELIKDKQKRANFGNQGRQKVLKMFDTIEIVEATLNSAC